MSKKVKPSKKELSIFLRQAILETLIDKAKAKWVKDSLKEMLKESK